MSKKRIEILGERPARVGYQKLLRARHLALDREVEFRMGLEDGTPEQATLFLQEMAQLNQLDHVAFPTLLDRGRIQGVPFYLVRRRSLPSLVDLVAARQLSLEERCQVVRSLFSAAAGAHAAGIELASLRPSDVRWSRAEGVVYLPHLPGRGDPEEYPFDFPAGFLAADPPHLARDVILVGQLSYWVLTGSPRAYGKRSGELVPTREKRPDVHPVLAEMVDACLTPRVEDRPENAVEIHEVMRRQGWNVLETPEVRDAHVPGQSWKLSLAEIKSAGGLPEMAPPKDPAGLALELRLPELPDLSDSARALTPRALVGLGVAAFLGVVLRVAWPEPVPPPPVATGRGAFVDYAGDPYLRHLREVEGIRPENFQEQWNLLRSLSLRKRLPPELDDTARFEGWRARFEEDPAAACQGFEAWLAELDARLAR